ncbi:DoxX family protein [Paenibacillus ehimensis]|uniref:DoxX family protein n=1 Tax=Paenibacillus ehimensis TaxID=79264 RepID=UPI001FE300DB|nr:DoxX family protein [Paenibacillus ehimensis]
MPGFPRLKEWAYAGIFVDMTGSAASHLFVGDYGVYLHPIWSAFGFAILALVKWVLRPKSRKL